MVIYIYGVIYIYAYIYVYSTKQYVMDLEQVSIS